jgi:autonomous glycyl radical cofactor
MITGIQITKAANDDLLNSFWLLDSEKGEAAACARKVVLLKMTWLR